MEVSIIRKAGRRLELAHRELGLAAESATFDDFETHWYVFLVASNNVFTILLAGARDSPRVRQWLGKCRKNRDGHPLKTYFYRARGDDEHGISSVVTQTMTAASQPTGRFSNERGYLMEEMSLPQSHEWSFFAELKPVRDREGNVYPPPKPAQNVQREVAAIDAANLYLEWLQGVFERCAELA